MAEYRTRFGTAPADDFPAELAALRRSRLAGRDTAGLLRLTPEGLAHSDALGPALFSARRTGRDGRVRGEVSRAWT